MTFRFVHTSDWHIGRAFGSFEADSAAVLRDARLKAVDRVAEIARGADASHVLVAGDIFDSGGLADKDLRQLLARLAQTDDLTWLLLPGNHDPDAANGLWDRIDRLGLPANAMACRQAEPVQIKDSVVVLPAPLSSRQMMHDPTDWFVSASRPDGTIVVGLAHGGVQDFGGESETAISIAQDRAASAGLDYLALGDWHGTKQISDRAYYSGTPEPDSYLGNDAGHVLVVEIAAAGAMPDVRPQVSAHYQWQHLEYTFGPLHSEDDLLRKLENEQGEGARKLVRLSLSGELDVSAQARLHHRLEAIGAAFFDFDARWDDVALLVAHSDGDLFDDETLGAVAARLQEQAGVSDVPDTAVQRRALELLARYTHSVRGEADER